MQIYVALLYYLIGFVLSSPFVALAYERSATLDSIGNKNHFFDYIFPSSGKIVSTIAGNGDSSENDGIGTFYASFKYPYGITTDFLASNILYVSDISGGSIRRINRNTAEVTTIAFVNGKFK